MAQALNLSRSVWAEKEPRNKRPCAGCLVKQLPAVVQPVLGLYWGVLPDVLNASSRLTDRVAHYVCDDRYSLDTDHPCGAKSNSTEGEAKWDVTWGQLRDNLMRKRALGALWNHNNGVPKAGPYAGIFAQPAFLKHLKKLGVRVILYERANGLAQAMSNSNTMTEQHIRAYKGTSMEAKRLNLPQLRAFNNDWKIRDVKYRTAFGALQREGIPVAYVTYERLMAQPDDFTRLFSFIGVEAPAAALHPSHSTKWHTDPPESYITNVNEVRRWINTGNLSLWSECMLDDSCATEPPVYMNMPEGW